MKVDISGMRWVAEYIRCVVGNSRYMLALEDKWKVKATSGESEIGHKLDAETGAF